MDLFEEIVRMRRAGQRGALATIVHTNGSSPSYESSRMLVREDGSSLGTVGGGCVEADVWAAAREVMHKEAPRKILFHLNNEATYDNGLICGGTAEIFIEPILPQPIVYLFGGGHVSTALAKAAQAVGFGVAVIDDREAFANVQRFPMAQEIFTSYEGAFAKLRPNSSSYLVIVTRRHKEDMRVLAWAVRTAARYGGAQHAFSPPAGPARPASTAPTYPPPRKSPRAACFWAFTQNPSQRPSVWPRTKGS